MIGIRMFDSVSEDALPLHAPAYAGYVDGKWPTYLQVKSKHPGAKVLSIAVFAKDDADVLDVERGDATIAEAAAWVKRQWGRGVKRPILYTSVGNWKALTAALEAAGIKHRPFGKSYRRWSAHYTYQPHRCGKACGMPGGKAGSTQWTNQAPGRKPGQRVDESLCGRSFFFGLS